MGCGLVVIAKFPLTVVPEKGWVIWVKIPVLVLKPEIPPA